MTWTHALIGLKFIIVGAFTLLVGVFTLIFVWGFCQSLQKWSTGRTSQNWPITEGQIVTSEAFDYDTQDGTSWRAKVRYSYKVSGTAYQGNCVKIDEYFSAGREWADEIVARYPVGTQVMVHYNPQRPREAVLETGLSGNWMLELVCCLVLGLVFGLVFCGVLIRIVYSFCKGRKIESLS